MRLYFSRLLTGRQRTWFCGVVGLAALAVAFYIAWQVGVELRRWPRVEAHVDSADVVTVGGAKGRPLYGARLLLSYHYQGLGYRISSTMGQQVDYGTAAQEAAKASQSGHVVVMVDPHRPESVIPRDGAAVGPLVIAGVFAVIGLLWLAFGILSWRTGQQEGLHRVPGFAPTSQPFAVRMFVGMGALFIMSAAAGALIGPQGKHWTSVQARIDSVDVVETSRVMYAVRTWYSYPINGQTYRSPVTASRSRSSQAAARGLAAQIEPGKSAALLVDPSNPYRIVLPEKSRIQGILIPAAFALFGVVLIAIGLVIRRRGMGGPYAAPGTGSVISPALPNSM